VSAASTAARIEALFDALADLDPEEAARVLHDECAGAPELRVAVERLLAHDRRAPEGFLAPRADVAIAVLASRALEPDTAEPRAPAGDLAPPLQLSARYEDAGAIGRGGMSVVRAVRDVPLRREIAVKVLHPRLAADAAQVERFVREARTTAQLEHPNVVPVYDQGSDAAGAVYFTMRRVVGRTLHDVLADAALAPGVPARLAVGLEIFLKTCDAVSFAHSRGVMHLDIKPTNVMVGSFGEVYLVDWGLAARRPAPSDVEATPGEEGPRVAGTPGFMAPELIRADLARVDERADVFALGVVLYRIASGRDPFAGASLAEVVRRNADADFVPADRVADVLVPRRLARLIDHALAREPEERTASVTELAREVRAFLHHGLHNPRETFPAGATIVREGEPGDAAYLVLGGHCRAYRTVGESRHVLRELGPGSFFGEGAILGVVARSASVDAVTDATLLTLTREVLEDRFADTWEGLLMRTMVERFRELDGART
jgi:serine/threonine-protein kinase